MMHRDDGTNHATPSARTRAPATPKELAASGAVVGMVLGTENATPLDWWVAVEPESYLQLGDVVQVITSVPGVGEIRISGMVDLVRAMHEGARFESDVFLADEGVLPVQIARSAHVVTTRIEPELWVPPAPGDPVLRVAGGSRDEALHFDTMEADTRVPAGEMRDGLPAFVDYTFLNGDRGAHVNISGISGIATKTSYASFLLYSIFHSDVLGRQAANTKGIFFNVKGEDLLFLDKPNAALDTNEKVRYEALGLPAQPFDSVGIWAPVRPQSQQPVPDSSSRQQGVTAYYWTVRDLVRDKLLRFMFAEAGDERSQIADLVSRVEFALDQECVDHVADPATVQVPEGGGGRRTIQDFAALCEYIEERLNADDPLWTRHTAPGTISAFLRRLHSAAFHLGHLVRGAGALNPDRHRIRWDDKQVSVVDIHKLHDRAKRFVVGVTITRLFDEKERSGAKDPLLFLVLDELNKYAPKDGWSPIKEVLLDIAERGRSLGIILIGAQQTASEVERRVVSNAAVRVVGRLDPAEAGRAEYGFLSEAMRKRSALLKPGHMLVQQPHLPVPLEIAFPFPAWATRKSEVATDPAEDPFRAFDRP